VEASPGGKSLERRRYPMAGIGDGKASIGRLIKKAQEMTGAEVLMLVEDTFDGLALGY
jgi:hypothetical protein